MLRPPSLLSSLVKQPIVILSYNHLSYNVFNILTLFWNNSSIVVIKISQVLLSSIVMNKRQYCYCGNLCSRKHKSELLEVVDISLV